MMTNEWKTFEIHIMNKITFLNEDENTYLTTNIVAKRKSGDRQGLNTSYIRKYRGFLFICIYLLVTLVSVLNYETCIFILDKSMRKGKHFQSKVYGLRPTHITLWNSSISFVFLETDDAHHLLVEFSH